MNKKLKIFENAPHHKSPHIHSKNKNGKKIIITYPGLKK